MSGDLIDDIEGQPLSGDDLRRMMGPGPRILSYPSLSQYGRLKDVMGHEGAAILYLSKPNYGHWVALCPGPTPGEISYFDSFGTPIDGHLEELSDKVRAQLGETRPYLTELIERALINDDIYKVNVNRRKLQSERDGIASCGRYAALRLLMNPISNEDFVDLITDTKGAGSVADRNVSLLTAML